MSFFTNSLLGWLGALAVLAMQAGYASVPGDADIRSSLGRGQIPFISNQGQVDQRVRFYADTLGGNVFVTGAGEIVYDLPKLEQHRAVKGVAVYESLVDSRLAEITAAGPSSARINYFTGKDPRNWKRNIPAWDTVSFGEVYSGISLELRAYGNNIEKLFFIRPGGDPRHIRLQLNGVERVAVNTAGELALTTELGPVTFTRPVAYQEYAGKRRYVDVAYQVEDREYGFRVGEYDRNRELVIDPLLASTYLGGSDDDGAFGVAVDAHGTVYVGGYTWSPDFPTTPGAYDRVGGSGLPNAFISRFTNSLTRLLASTYLGGDGVDIINGITTYRDFTTGIDYVYAVGQTGSVDFPTTLTAYDRILATFGPPGVDGFQARLTDAFVVKFDADLQNLLASTYLGETDRDIGTAISVTRTGTVFVTGFSAGTASDFPTTPGAYYRTGVIGSQQTFVSSLNTDLQSLLASTLFGGPGTHIARTIHVSRQLVSNLYVEYVYIAGTTQPFNIGSDDFPTTVGAYDRDFNGGPGDAFVSKFDSGLTSLLASTFLGSTFDDYAWSLRVHSDRSVFVTGYTQSPEFPVTQGAYDTTFNGNQDVFVSRLDGNLQTLIASTFLGGEGWDSGWALDLDYAGDVYLTGDTSSGDYPTTPGAPDRSYNGSIDAFISMLTPALNRLVYSSYLGLDQKNDVGIYTPVFQPTHLDAGYAIVIDKVRCRVYVAGQTQSGDPTISPTRPYPSEGYDIFPVLPVPPEGYSAPSAYDITYNGGSGYAAGDAFVSQFLQQIPRACVQDDIVVDFGQIGLWGRMNDSEWYKLGNLSPDIIAVGDIDSSDQDDIVADFATAVGGIFVKRDKIGGWTQLHNYASRAIEVADLDGGGKEDIVVDFGPPMGLWARMNDNNWLKLSNSSPDQLVLADMDGNGQADVVGDFGSTLGGLFVKRNLGGWSQLHNDSPLAMTTGDLDGNGKDDVVIHFPAIGLWARMNDSDWLKLHNGAPELIASGDVDGNGMDDVLATFGSSVGGLWQKLNLGGWTKISNSEPDRMVTGDIDGTTLDDVVADFGSSLGGIFVRRDNGGWVKLHNMSSEDLDIGNLDGI